MVIIKRILEVAPTFGFDRVQFTGGEPLLSPELVEVANFSRQHFKYVGVTTNGTLLQERLPDILNAGVTEVHVSIPEDVHFWNEENFQSYLQNITEAICAFNGKQIETSVNLPVGRLTGKPRLLAVLVRLSLLPVKIRVFDVWESGQVCARDRPITPEQIQDHYLNLEERNEASSLEIRTIYKPKGIRCKCCSAVNSCFDRSKALRVSPDGVLKPCLASRDWDIAVSGNDVENKLAIATLLARDY